MINANKLKYLILLLYFFAPTIFAGVFDPPPTDKSLEYLGTIFGSNVGTIYLGGTPNPVLSAMFEKFNIMIVSVAVVVISYIGIVSTINTAQEGQTMGRKWSSIWLPMRSMLGMLLMVPTPGTGYSMIQATVMWIIVQSIGAADSMWNLVLDYFEQGISASGDFSFEGNLQIEENAKTLAQSILNAAVCMEGLKKVANGQAENPNGDKIEASEDFTKKYGAMVRPYKTMPTTEPQDITTYDVADPSIGENGITYTGNLNIGVKNPAPGEPEEFSKFCGSFNITANVSPSEIEGLKLSSDAAKTAEIASRAKAAYDAKALAAELMFSALRPIARKIVDRTDDAQTLPSGYIDIAIKAYTNLVGTIIKPQKQDQLSATVDSGKRAGWAVAGSFYFVLNNAIKQTLLATASIPLNGNDVPACPVANDSCKNKDYISVDDLSVINDYLINEDEQIFLGSRLFHASEYYEDDSNKSTSQTALNFSGAGGDANKFLSPLQALNKKAINWIQETIGKSGDPLLNHARFGSNLMLAAEIAWITISAVSIALAIGMGLGACASSGFLAFLALAINIITPILAILAVLWICGATMSIYLPMIPYMIYTIAVLGWFLLVIEAIMAAPILSLGLVVPSGDEIGKVAQGLLLLVSLFLRPVLMIFGFILAARVYKAIIGLVHFGLAGTFDTIDITGSLLSPVAAMILYVGFAVALANKCFTLIYMVPDKILRWIGGPVEQTDAGALQETKGTFQAGAKAAGEGGEGAAKGGMEKMQAKGEAKNKEKKENAKKDPSGIKK